MSVETKFAWAAGVIDAGLRYKINLGGKGIGVQARVRVPSRVVGRALAQGFGLRVAGNYVNVPAIRVTAFFQSIMPFSQRYQELVLILKIREAVRAMKRGKSGEQRKALKTLLMEYRKNILTSGY